MTVEVTQADLDRARAEATHADDEAGRLEHEARKARRRAHSLWARWQDLDIIAHGQLTLPLEEAE